MLIIFIYLAHLVNKTPALRTILSITTRRLNEGGGNIRGSGAECLPKWLGYGVCCRHLLPLNRQRIIKSKVKMCVPVHPMSAFWFKQLMLNFNDFLLWFNVYTPTMCITQEYLLHLVAKRGTALLWQTSTPLTVHDWWGRDLMNITGVYKVLFNV